jgi:adenylate kinase family enzyme
VDRVVVVGGPGSGKSFVAAQLANVLGVAHVELDALWWGPRWKPTGPNRLRDDVSDVLALDCWIVDGNYIDEVADLMWRRADVIVWLDPPRRVAVRRAVRRSVRRVLSAEELWNGNRESLAVLSPRSITTLIRRWPSYSERIAETLVDLEIPVERVVRLHSDAEQEQWLEHL